MDELVVALAVLGLYIPVATFASVCVVAAWMKWGPRG